MCFSYNYLAIFVNRIVRFFHSLTLAVSLAKRAKKDVNKMTESYLTKNKVEFFLFTDKNMNRTIADEKDKVEILISTEKEGKRFETTYKDLLEILESADEKLSQSRKI